MKQESTNIDNKVEVSLLDITYPYYNSSMLAKSQFSGFQTLLFECGIYFTFVYMVTNYINSGFALEIDIFIKVANNLIQDFIATVTIVILCLIQTQIIQMFLKILQRYSKSFIYIYCSVWLLGIVFGGLYLVRILDLYFTDKILIIVSSWAFPIKTASYCLDIYQGIKIATIIQRIKFILSPKIVYKNYIKQHNSSLPIHKSYLIIKSIVALLCLLINYILVAQIISPYFQASYIQKMSLIQLFFRLIPLTFYINVCLYYLIMQNILLAMAEITQLKNRHFYQDWWNSQTISQFLDKWVILINQFSDNYIPFKKLTKHALHLIIIFLMKFSIFSDSINLRMIIFAAFNILTVYFLGQNKKIQNNYLVHFLTIAFTPFTLAIQLKYQIFT